MDAIAAVGEQHHGRFFRLDFRTAFFRQCSGSVVGKSVAVGGDRTGTTLRTAARADGAAEVHQALGVATQGGGIVRQAGFGCRP